jgi:hypothetical protein
MSGFPIAWDDGSSDQAIPTSICPYAKEEIEEYLQSNHHRWVLEEPPLGFQVGVPLLHRQEISRNYWLVSAIDELERQWFILVGSGMSPFNSKEKMWRWMYAERNDLNQAPDAYYDDAYAEQLVHDVRDDR